MYQTNFMALSDGKPLSKSVEIASVSVVAEKQRSKGGFLKPLERINYISKLYYPLYICKVNGNEFLVVDAVPLFARQLEIKKIPDVTPFIEDLGNTSTLEEFLEFLKKYMNYFDDFESVSQEQISGLFPAEWLSNVQDLFRNLNELEITAPVIDAKIMESDVDLIKTKISEYKMQTLQDVNLLEKALQNLEEKSLQWNDAVLAEEKEIAFKYMDQIKVEREQFETAKSKLENEKKEKLKELEESYKLKLEELKTKLDELKKREREALNLLNEAKKLQDNTLINVAENDLNNVRKQIQIVNNKIRNLESEKKLEISRIEEQYKSMIELERNRIMVTAAKRDGEIKEKEKMRLNMVSCSDYIKDRINRLIQEKRKILEELEKTTVKYINLPSELNVVKVCIPFYVIQYSSNKGLRYLTLFPVKIGNPGYFAKLFGKQVPVQEWNQLVYGIQLQLDSLLKTHPEVQKMINDLAYNNNLFLNSETLALLKRGLQELVRSQWLTQEEATAIQNALQQYFQAPPPPP